MVVAFPVVVCPSVAYVEAVACSVVCQLDVRSWAAEYNHAEVVGNNLVLVAAQRD